jgi:hypothetical protein
MLPVIIKSTDSNAVLIFSCYILCFRTSYAQAPTIIKSDPWITRVGTPKTDRPGSGPVGKLGFTVTCPLDPVNNSNFNVTCGTYAYPAANGCGHGKPPTYQTCDPKIYAECGPVVPPGQFRQHGEFLKKSIDVAAPAGATVYLPFINGSESAQWTRVPQNPDPFPINGSSWGYKTIYTTTYQGKQILLDLTHINQAFLNPALNLSSGSPIATIFNMGGSHLHTGLKVNNVPVEAQKDAFMCSKERP